jgi:DNA polymerase I
MDQLPYPTVEMIDELLAELKVRGGYDHVILGDTEFEFGGVNGNLLRPVCGVFKDLTIGQEWRLRRGQFGRRPPFSTGPDTLFVAYYASAEMGFFRALDWPMPVRILDLFTEFRNLTNGLPVESNKLIHALEYFGLDTIGAHYKAQMIELILRGPPWTEEEWQAILDYCAGDVGALERLLPAMLPYIDLPRALFRGRYMGALAVVENYGVPLDVPRISLAQKHWTDIQDDLIAEIDADYGVFDGRTFKEDRFEAYLERNNIPWPRLESGRLDLDDSKRRVFREMAKIYPSISPLRELRHALSTMRLFNDLTIGEDGRNRAMLSAFRSITGRNQPSNANFIFGTSTWIRGFIKPPPGHGIAYIDWASQEVCIGAALSGDKNMMADTAAGRDPYIEFGIRAGLLPARSYQEGQRGRAGHAEGVCARRSVRHGRQDLSFQDREIDHHSPSAHPRASRTVSRFLEDGGRRRQLRDAGAINWHCVWLECHGRTTSEVALADELSNASQRRRDDAAGVLHGDRAWH